MSPRPLVTSCLLVSLALVIAAEAAWAGPLRRCCSKAGVFCHRNFRGTDQSCADFGGTVSMANECSEGKACVVAHQRAVTGSGEIQLPGQTPSPVNVKGKADVIEIEMVQLHLVSVATPVPSPGPSPSPSGSPSPSPSASPGQPTPVRIDKKAAPPSQGAFNPGGNSFYNLFLDIGLPTVPALLSNQAPLQVQAATPPGTSFPPDGIPYVSTAPVQLFDRMGTPAGSLLSLTLVFMPHADADGDAIPDEEDECPATPPGAPPNDYGCSDAQLCGPDADGDGVVDATDDCSGTAPGAAVDASGCSLEQFCTAQDATTAAGKNRCRKLDWQNDEPTPRPIESDCVVDRGGRGSADDRCLPRP